MVGALLPSSRDFMGAIRARIPEMSFPGSLVCPPGTGFGLVAYQKHLKLCGRVVSYVSAGLCASWPFDFGINATKT